MPDMSTADLEYFLHQLSRIAVQLVEAVRVSIAALARCGLLALLSRLQVLATDAGRAGRWAT